MVYASHFQEEFEAAAGFGWNTQPATFDWSKLIANKDAEITRLEGLYRKGLENAGADIFDDRAVLAGKHEVHLERENRTVTAEKIIIAVGGTPNPMTSMPGHEHCITSDDVFHLEQQPASIVIQGGGYIAVEFACIFAGLGTDVTIVYRGEEILRGFDMDVRTLLHGEMASRGIKGRLPMTQSLVLEKAGVQTSAGGFIKVDPYSRTSADSIWALGDVTDRVPLTPVAIHEAMCFIDTEYRDIPTRPDHELIATAVFSQPEIGTIGLSEEDASEKYNAVDVYRAHFRPMKHTLSGSGEKMLMKIITESDNGRVVGVHVMGAGAAEIIQALGVAIKIGATKEDFDRTMAVHPTAAEELVTMYQPSYRIADGKRV